MKDIVNFRVNKEIKDNFKDVCRLSNSCMSYEIIKFMKNYISNEGVRIKDELRKMGEVETLTSRIKDKIGSRNMNDSRLKDWSF